MNKNIANIITFPQNSTQDSQTLNRTLSYALDGPNCIFHKAPHESLRPIDSSQRFWLTLHRPYLPSHCHDTALIHVHIYSHTYNAPGLTDCYHTWGKSLWLRDTAPDSTTWGVIVLASITSIKRPTALVNFLPVLLNA